MTATAQQERRIRAIAFILGEHSGDVLDLAEDLRRGRRARHEVDRLLLRRLGRSVVALLAVTHEEGPP